MPRSRNFHSLVAELFFTYGTIDDFIIRAARRASCSHFVLFDRFARRMPRSRNFHSLAAQFFFAYGAIDDFLIRAARHASCSHFVLTHGHLFPVPQSSDRCRLFLATGADTLHFAFFDTSRRDDDGPLAKVVRVFGLIACRKHRKPANRKCSRKQQNAKLFHKFPPNVFCRA